MFVSELFRKLWDMPTVLPAVEGGQISVRSLVTMIGEGPMSTPLAVTNARRVEKPMTKLVKA